ncbi:hypothetical protein GCM10023324_49700 [Streptomyces youssoufiensis]
MIHTCCTVASVSSWLRVRTYSPQIHSFAARQPFALMTAYLPRPCRSHAPRVPPAPLPCLATLTPGTDNRARPPRERNMFFNDYGDNGDP